jgi:hypothetical protein
MKSTVINTLSYTGIVTLSQYIGNKKIEIAQVHNEGGNPLFSFFSDCLIGDFESARINRPIKIMLLKRISGEVSDDYESKSDYIHLTTPAEKVYDDSLTEGIVRYSFIVTRDKLENTDFNCIGLYSGSTKLEDFRDYAAICSVGDMIISPSSALLIDWKLYISNS